MTDPHFEDLTKEEHEALVAISDHAIAPPLSPAAQAVFDAFGKYPIDHDNPSCGILYGALPAALRAASAQLTSAKASDTLRSIAAEVEALPDG